jgi:HSP20 family protein
MPSSSRPTESSRRDDAGRSPETGRPSEAGRSSGAGRPGEMARRSDPFESLSPFGLTFGRLFDDLWSRPRGDGDRMIAPLVDVCETDDAFEISAELPGLRKEDVKIQVEDNVLSISGEKRFEQADKTKDFHRLERRYGSFHRSIAFPTAVSADQAEATFRDGVLQVRIPKSEDAKPRTVSIK